MMEEFGGENARVSEWMRANIQWGMREWVARWNEKEWKKIEVYRMLAIVGGCIANLLLCNDMVQF